MRFVLILEALFSRASYAAAYCAVLEALFSRASYAAAYCAVLLGVLLVPGVLQGKAKPKAPAVKLPASLSPSKRKHDGFYGSEAFIQFRRSGREVVREQPFDIDGDGLDDALVVERSDSGLGVSAFRNLGQGSFRFLWRSLPSPASSLHRWDGFRLGDRPAFLLDVMEDNPDEAVHWIHLFQVRQDKLEPIFASRYWEMHPEEEAGRKPVRLVDLGGEVSGFKMGPPGVDWPQIWVRENPKRLELIDAHGRPVWVIIGIRERIYEARDGRYAESRDEYVDFLELLQPAKLVAGAAQPGHGADKACDGKLDTGWRPGAAAGDKAWLQASFGQAVAVRALRLVPNCGEDSQAIKRIHLRLNGRKQPMTLELDGKYRPPWGVMAWGEYKLPGRNKGDQLLIFFEGPRAIKRLQMRVETEGEAGEGKGACVAEWSLYRARKDRIRATSKTKQKSRP